jgi:hypothetical protein
MIDFDVEGVESFFAIPEDMLGKTPCQVSPIIYEDPALDISLDDSEWLALDSAEQKARLDAKRAAEELAISACNTCPLLAQCKDWAMKMQENVFGVVGGTTIEQRSNNVVVREVVNAQERGPRGRVRDDLIIQWAEAGASNKVIASRLGCNVRTVERRRLRLAEEAAAKDSLFVPVINDLGVAGSVTIEDRDGTAAAKDLAPNRVSPETALIFDALMDGALRDREQIINSLIPFVSEEVALSTAPMGRSYDSFDAQVKVGARKFLMNRIDIAVRRGRLISMSTEAGKTLICMEESAARTWRAHKTA